MTLSLEEKQETHWQGNDRSNVSVMISSNIDDVMPTFSLSLSLTLEERTLDDSYDKRNSQIFNLHDRLWNHSAENSSRHTNQTDLSERGRRLTRAIDVLEAVEASITIRSSCFISRLSISRFRCRLIVPDWEIWTVDFPWNVMFPVFQCFNDRQIVEV